MTGHWGDYESIISKYFINAKFGGILMTFFKNLSPSSVEFVEENFGLE